MKDGFDEFLVEQMAGFAPVSVRRMFGGHGIFHDRLMLALVVDQVLYLKADALTRGDFEAEGLEAFSYAAGGGRKTVMSYMRAPERCLEDPDEMTEWCRKAYAAALRSRKPEGGARRKGRR